MDEGVARFNALPAEQARAGLRSCCAATRWIEAMLAGRPYTGIEALTTRATHILAGLDWAGIREAIDVHPRIGERPATTSQEAGWSAAEQSGMDTASAQTRAHLVDANRAYEDRFGHVFLIFATGLTDVEMLLAARDRVHHAVDVEREVVRAELAKIVNLRILKLIAALEDA